MSRDVPDGGCRVREQRGDRLRFVVDGTRVQGIYERRHRPFGGYHPRGHRWDAREQRDGGGGGKRALNVTKRALDVTNRALDITLDAPLGSRFSRAAEQLGQAGEYAVCGAHSVGAPNRA